MNNEKLYACPSNKVVIVTWTKGSPHRMVKSDSSVRRSEDLVGGEAAETRDVDHPSQWFTTKGQ